MTEITIELLEKSDLEKLYKFEVDNREYFNRLGFPRGEDYYRADTFKSIVEELIEEQDKGLSYMYLIYDNKQEIVGRVNLVSVVRGNLNKAEIGYRIGEEHQGKGYATYAVGLLLEEALKIHKLHRIEAGTSPKNIGSQVVLVKNGFQFTGRNSKFIYQNGQWIDSINFEKVLD